MPLLVSINGLGSDAGSCTPLAPSDLELDWARRVLAADKASCGAAVRLDGRMIDLPVVLQARRTLARARVEWEG